MTAAEARTLTLEAEKRIAGEQAEVDRLNLEQSVKDRERGKEIAQEVLPEIHTLVSSMAKYGKYEVIYSRFCSESFETVQALADALTATLKAAPLRFSVTHELRSNSERNSMGMPTYTLSIRLSWVAASARILTQTDTRRVEARY